MHWTERLSDYQDRELTPAEHAACEAHLALCQECRDLLAELQSVTSAARADVDRDPSNDLWPGILSQIQGQGLTRPIPFRHSPRTISFSLPQLALAASLLIAVSAGVSFVAAGRSIARPAPQEDPIQAVAETLTPPAAGVVRANFADPQFDQAVVDLEKILLDQRAELDPRTVMVIERNLTVIDDAMRQARAALDADPGNTFLNSHLADARRRKLDLLRRATTLASPSGD